MVILVDGDVVVMRAAYAAQANEEPTEQDVAWNIDSILKHISKQYPDSAVVCFISGGPNFRARIDEGYKANRRNQARPLLEKEARQYIEDKYTAILCPHIETDDMLSILQWYSINDRGLDDSQTVIATIDKDLDQVPGHHFNFVTGEQYFVERLTASYLYWKQVLTGDPVDNIKGIPGVGKKRAAAILDPVKEDAEEMQQAVELAYESHSARFEKIGTHYVSALHDTEQLIGMLRVPAHYMLKREEIDEIKEIVDEVVSAYF